LSWLRYLGVTPPISISESSEREKEVTSSLMDELRRQNTIESEEETRTRYLLLLQHILGSFVSRALFYSDFLSRSSLLPQFNDYDLSRRCLYLCVEHALLTSLPAREIVLGRLAALVKSFVKTVSISCEHSEAAAEMAGGKIFTFGSYRLGVHGPGSDIDTLCVVPKHVSREDFFNVFEKMLRDTEGVTEVSVSHLSLPCERCR
jgi:poly(A) polymerase